MKNNCCWIGIGINFSPNDNEYPKLQELNDFLNNNYKNSYLFDPVNNQPHINLYDIDVPETNLLSIENTLETVALESKSFIITLGQINFFEHGTIYIECLKDNSLVKLEEEIVTKIANFKDDCKTEEYWEPWRKYDEKQIKNRDKYGNPHVMESFVPHITIGFIKTDKKMLQEITERLNKELKIKEVLCKHIDLVVHDNESKLIKLRSFRVSH